LGRVDSIGNVVFFSYLFKTATSGEIGFGAGAEGATAPETLRQKGPRGEDSIWKEAPRSL